MPDQIPFASVPLDAVTMSTPYSSSDKDPSRLKEACSELESLFIYYLLKEMRATVPKSGFISGGKTEEMYTSMLDLQLAKEIASKREIGISSALLDQLGSKDVHHKESTNENTKKTELDNP